MKRQKHNLSNYKLATADMGQLIPVQVQEVLPGDTMQIDTSALIRMSPMLAPVMHPMTVRFHHWFVPNRLVWDGWEDFITGGEDGDNSDMIPTVTQTDDANNLLDYMGVPPVDGAEVNAIPIRAYNLIYNEFYRDQDLQGEWELDNLDVKNVAWRKDYFTASRPFAQKGNDVILPIGDSAPVLRNPGFDTDNWLNNEAQSSDIALNESNQYVSGLSGDGTPLNIHPNYLHADLSQATGITASQFREFFALQRFAEARARYGSRYTEYLQYMGVRPSDARLQRPEYLGGGKKNLQISEVLQTAQDDQGQEETFVGTMRGHGITALKTRKARKFFEEHGTIITVMSVVPKSIYQDGSQRLFLKRDRNQFFQKELQSIGQQEIKKGEVYTTEDNVNNHDTFGYTDRYSEYTWTPSTISGEFRNILDHWHLGRTFEQPPELNSAFISCWPSKRIFAEQTKHSLWCMINNKTIARRIVQKKSVGRLM